MAEPALKLKVDVVGAQQGAAELAEVAKANEAVGESAVKASQAAKKVEEDLAKARADVQRQAARNLDKVYDDEVASAIRAQKEKKAAEAQYIADRVVTAEKSAQAFGKAEEAIGGIANKAGGARDVVTGLGQAASGGAGAFFGLQKAVSGFFTVVRGGASVIGGLALGLTAVKVALDFWVKKSDEARDSGAKFVSQQERIAEAMKEVEDASVKSFTGAKQKVEELTEAYKVLNQQIDAAAQRVDRLNAAQTKFQIAQLDKQEAEALAKAATNPEAQQTIQRDFARRREDIRTQGESTRIDNTILKAGVEEKAAQDALRGFREQLDAASLATKQARDSAEGERSKLAAVGQGEVDTPFARALRDSVKVSDAAAQAAAQNEDKLRAQLQPQIEDANRRISGARDNRTLAELEKRTLETERSTTKTTRITQDKGTAADQKKRLDALAAETAAAQEGGDFAAQNAAVTERDKLIASGKVPTAPTLRSPFARTGESTINGQPLAAPGSGNRINRGADFEAAADAIKNTPPLDAAPIAEPVKEVSEAVKAQADQSQANIKAAGEQITATTANLGPAPDISPLVQAVEALAAAQQQQMADLRRQFNDAQRQINALAMQQRNIIA